MNSSSILAMRRSSSLEKGLDSSSFKDPANRKSKPSRDPQSHRIIEKRRRDRMNQSLSDLSRLIPSAYLKQGQSRMEKAEIIELATQHLVALSAELKKCEALLGIEFPGSDSPCCIGKFYLGFREASKSAVAFLIEEEGLSSNDPLCSKLRAHLQNMSQRLLPDEAQLRVQSINESTDAEPKFSEGPDQHSPASCCSTDEARSDASFDAVGGTHAERLLTASGTRDPKMNLKAAEDLKGIEGEAKITKSTEGRKRRAVSPLPDHGGRSPDYRDRVRLLGGLDETAYASSETEPFLPGFVLHESGTYYEPVVIPPASLGLERLSHCQKPLHPVSIPVNFRTTRFVRTFLPPDA